MTSVIVPSDPITGASFGITAHYVYRSGDRTRAYHRNGETACFACHVEHSVCHAPQQAADRCLTCHDFHAVKDHLSRLVRQ